MDLHAITHALRQDAVSVVFVNVLLQQLGLPIPAVPTLLVAGSLLLLPGQALAVLAAAVLASLIADAVWYSSGRAFGYRLLSGLCRLSINPSSCVSQTERRFVRWGLWSLVVAKFVPGFSTVAPPIAGALRMSFAGFLAASSVGATLWSGAAILAGWVVSERVQAVLEQLEREGNLFVALVLALFGLWLGWKFWQRFRFQRLAAIPHISPEELLAALASPAPPRLLDLRGPLMIRETGIVPGALAVDHDHALDAVRDWPRDTPIVTLCACPEDAAAVQVACELTRHGYRAVRPLAGGFDALPEGLRPLGGAVRDGSAQAEVADRRVG